MNTVTITRTFVVALVLVLTATGLWAAVPDLVMYALEQYWTIYVRGSRSVGQSEG